MKIRSGSILAVVGALSFATPSWGCGPEGGFGVSFNQAPPENLSYRWIRNAIGIPSAEFQPSQQSAPFENFKLVVTPATQRVFSIEAKRRFPNHAAALGALQAYYQQRLQPSGVLLPKELKYQGLLSKQGTINGSHIFISAEDEVLTIYCRDDSLAHQALDELGVTVPASMMANRASRSWRDIAREYEAEASAGEPAPKKTVQSKDNLYKERTTEDVMQVIASQQEGILRLYYRALLRVPDMGGVVNFLLNIDAEGEVIDAQIQDTNLNDRIFEARLLDYIKQVPFGARAGGSYQVVYPLFLSPPN